MKKFLIGFVGPKTSGKSLAASYLIKVGFKPLNFKDELDHELFVKFYGLLEVLSDRYKTKIADLVYKKPLKPEIRELKKCFGTNVMRRIDEDYWVNKWLMWYRLYKYQKVVVDDVRFNNEARVINKNGGILIRIVRKQKGKKDTHQSETEQCDIKCDFTIDNNGTKEELRKNLQTVLALVNTKKCWTRKFVIIIITGLLLLGLLVGFLNFFSEAGVARRATTISDKSTPNPFPGHGLIYYNIK